LLSSGPLCRVSQSKLANLRNQFTFHHVPDEFMNGPSVVTQA
jgi:hypothetical protein